MAFRFSLETVLRYRENLERIEEIALHKIVQEIAGVQTELDQLEKVQEAFRVEREKGLEDGLPAGHLQDLAYQEAQLVITAETLRSKLRELEASRVAQLAVYHKAQQERAILSEVREQKLDEHTREQLRKEQKTLDDLFLARLQNDR